MAYFPTITYTNLKHKVANGVSGGQIQTKDESITIVFDNGNTMTNKYKVSLISPFNQITGTLNSDRELTKWEARVTPIEVDDYGPTVGNRAAILTGVSANTNTNFTITITAAVFTGSQTNTYRISLMGQSSLDHSWDCTQLYMVIDTNTTFTNTYTEVEYLEATGSQYLDSNYVPNINTVIKGKYLHSENSADTPLFGSRTSSMANSYTFWAHPSDHTNTSYKSQMIFNGVTKTFSEGNLPYGQINTFYYSKSLFRLNGVEMSVSTNSGSPELSLIIFGLRNGTSIDSRKFIGRIYEFNISENGTAVRDFVPCIRNSDNKPGMYDRVNNAFYTNQGSGEFKYGPLKSVPQTYQQVEYVESQGSQYIDSGVICSNLLKITCDFSVTNAGSPSRNYVFGCYSFNPDVPVETDSNHNGNRIQFSYSNQSWYGWGSNYITPSVTVVSNTRHKIFAESSGWYLDNSLIYTPTSTAFNQAKNLMLFCNNSNGTAYAFSSGVKIYSINIYSNGLIRKFIPCYRKSDNVIGMLDLVNNVFYTNAGSGTFIKGNNVSNKNYIKYKPTDSNGYDVHFVN